MNQAAQSDAPAPRPRLGRRWNSARFQGIRFRLGTAMALALLPILILIVIQTQADFRRQADDRRTDLQLAAERSAGSAKARLDSAQVLLRALSPDALGPYCASRPTAIPRDVRRNRPPRPSGSGDKGPHNPPADRPVASPHRW